jgi:uncharacterized protein (TIGR03086 family)
MVAPHGEKPPINSGETMTTISSDRIQELYLAATSSTLRIIENIEPGLWDNATPCTEWNLRVLVNHLIGENAWVAELFAGKTIAEVDGRLDGDLTGDDPIKAYVDTAGPARTAIEAPGAMEFICHLGGGDAPGSRYATELFIDTVIHGWDVAKGSGQNATLDPDLAQACYEIVAPMEKVLQRSGAFGSGVPIANDADLQTRLLAVVGRRADWSSPQ